MVSKVAKTNLAKVASSRAGRISPASRVVSNADLKQRPSKSRAFPYWKFISTFRLCVPKPHPD